MLETLLNEIKKNTKKTVQIKINDNKSHYFVLKDCKRFISLSIHRFFLKAPAEILDALVRYVYTKKKQDFHEIKRFIYSNQSKLDFSKQIDKRKLNTEGQYFDLEKEYKEVNSLYFENRYKLNITWFSSTYKTFRHITFGSYDRQYKLIRINKKLDHENVTQEYIQYLIFHEILHEVYPSKILKGGRCQMHSKEFKDHEKKFPNYDKMKAFEEYFIKNIWRKNGRS